MYTLSAIFHDTETGKMWRVIIWRWYETAKEATAEIHKLLKQFDGYRVTIADWEISKTEG